MDEKIREAFGEIRMRESFSQALELHLAQQQVKQTGLRRQRKRKFAAIAAVLALVTVLLAINPNVVSAVGASVETIFRREPPRHHMLHDEIVYSDPAVRVKRLKEDYSLRVELPVKVHPWLHTEGGRLYYVDYRDNRIRTDLTDLLSEEEPVYIQFVDDYGLCHYLAIAGSYNGEEEIPDTVWFLELLWNPEQIRREFGLDPAEHPYASGGYEDIHTEGEIMDRSGERLPWFQKAKEYYHCPWS